MTGSLVTVHIPVFNEGAYLRETIQSVRRQTLKRIAIVVTDNCSDDQSFEIAREAAREDPRIFLLRHQTNIGAAGNFESALPQVATKYFCWLGAHDLMEPDYLEAAVRSLGSCPEAVMAYPSGAFFIDAAGDARDWGPACSDIATVTGERAISRFIGVVRNLAWCTNIHGVFVTEAVRSIPIERVVGSDNLMLAVAALKGEILQIPVVGLRRREKHQENTRETEERRRNQGVYHVKLARSRRDLVAAHRRAVLGARDVTWLDKLLYIAVLHSEVDLKYRKLPEWYEAMQCYEGRAGWWPNLVRDILIGLRAPGYLIWRLKSRLGARPLAGS
jgi:O-antigen biosynthesis protein